MCFGNCLERRALIEGVVDGSRCPSFLKTCVVKLAKRCPDVLGDKRLRLVLDLHSYRDIRCKHDYNNMTIRSIKNMDPRIVCYYLAEFGIRTCTLYVLVRFLLHYLELFDH